MGHSSSNWDCPRDHGTFLVCPWKRVVYNCTIIPNCGLSNQKELPRTTEQITQSWWSQSTTKHPLTDFEKHYDPADRIGKLHYSSVASIGFGIQYVTVHHYFFFTAFLDPWAKSLMKDMMTIVDFRKLKSDIIDVMITEGLLVNCKSVWQNHRPLCLMLGRYWY